MCSGTICLSYSLCEYVVLLSLVATLINIWRQLVYWNDARQSVGTGTSQRPEVFPQPPPPFPHPSRDPFSGDTKQVAALEGSAHSSHPRPPLCVCFSAHRFVSSEDSLGLPRIHGRPEATFSTISLLCESTENLGIFAFQLISRSNPLTGVVH